MIGRLLIKLEPITARDRKSTRLNSSHLVISYAVFCLKKKIPRFSLSRSQQENALPCHWKRATSSSITHSPDRDSPPSRSYIHTINRSMMFESSDTRVD